MSTLHVEIVSDQKNVCGEAPTWDAANSRILWVDNEKSLIFEHRLSDNQTSVINRNLPVSGLALNRDGRLVVGGARGVYLISEAGDISTVLENSASCPAEIEGFESIWPIVE